MSRTFSDGLRRAAEIARTVQGPMDHTDERLRRLPASPHQIASAIEAEAAPEGAEAPREAVVEAAKRSILDAPYDWARWPKLAAVFAERPRVNVYWVELADFIASMPRHFYECAPAPEVRAPSGTGVCGTCGHLWFFHAGQRCTSDTTPGEKCGCIDKPWLAGRAPSPEPSLPAYVPRIYMGDDMGGSVDAPALAGRYAEPSLDGEVRCRAVLKMSGGLCQRRRGHYGHCGLSPPPTPRDAPTIVAGMHGMVPGNPDNEPPSPLCLNVNCDNPVHRPGAACSTACFDVAMPPRDSAPPAQPTLPPYVDRDGVLNPESPVAPVQPQAVAAQPACPCPRPHCVDILCKRSSPQRVCSCSCHEAVVESVNAPPGAAQPRGETARERAHAMCLSCRFYETGLHTLGCDAVLRNEERWEARLRTEEACGDRYYKAFGEARGDRDAQRKRADSFRHELELMTDNRNAHRVRADEADRDLAEERALLERAVKLLREVDRGSRHPHAPNCVCVPCVEARALLSEVERRAAGGRDGNQG